MVGSIGAAGGGQPNKSMAAFRSLELCDRLKLEIENITSEIGAHQVDREEYEKKFRGQLMEMDRIQHSLKMLQETHMAIKQQYEDEISRLRHLLESHPHSQGSDPEGRGPSSLQGISGGMSMGSTGRQGHTSSPLVVKGLSSMGPGGGGGHSLASPRKQDIQGPLIGRSPMLGPPVSQMMGPGGGGGGQVLLPGMMRRGGQLEDEYGRGPGGGLGPNGQTVEPLNKRPRLSPSAGPGPYSHGGLHNPSQGGQQQQQGGGGGNGQGPGGGPGGSLRGSLHRLSAAPPGGGGVDNARRSGGGGSGPVGGADGQQQYRGPPGPSVGAGGTMGAPMGSASLPPPHRPGSGGGMVGGGGGAREAVAAAAAAEAAVVGGEGGSGMVEIPDAIPAELSYDVRYEGEGADAEAGPAERLAVKLNKSQDLRSVVCCVRFSTDGTKIAAGSHSCVKVFDVSTFRQLYMCRKIPERGQPEADPYVRAVCFSPDGRCVVAGMEKNSAKVLVLGDEGGQHGAITLSGHESEVYSLDWVSTMIASGSGDGRIRLWDSVTGACQASLGDSAGPQDGVTSVVLKQDTKMVAAASIDRIVHVWSTQTHKLLHRLDGHTESVYAVTFSHDGNRLVSGGLDKTIKVWDLGPGSEGRLSPQAQTLPGGHSDYVLSVCFSQDGKYIISGSKDRSVTIWDAKLMKKVATVTGFKNSVIGVSASPTNGTFATGSGDNLVCVWKYIERRPASPPPPASTTASAHKVAGGASAGAGPGGPNERPKSSLPASAPKESEMEKRGGGGEGSGSKAKGDKGKQDGSRDGGCGFSKEGSGSTSGSGGRPETRERGDGGEQLRERGNSGGSGNECGDKKGEKMMEKHKMGEKQKTGEKQRPLEKQKGGAGPAHDSTANNDTGSSGISGVKKGSREGGAGKDSVQASFRTYSGAADGARERGPSSGGGGGCRSGNGPEPMDEGDDSGRYGRRGRDSQSEEVERRRGGLGGNGGGSKNDPPVKARGGAGGEGRGVGQQESVW